MAYPEKGATYAGTSKAEKLCRADGGSVGPKNKDIPPLKIEPKISIGEHLRQQARAKLANPNDTDGGLPFFGMMDKKK